MPAGPSIFYSATEEALTVFAGDFMGSSTPSFSVQADEYYAQTGDYSGIGNPFSLALGPNGNVYTLQNALGAQSTTASISEYPPNFGCMGPIASLNGLSLSGETIGSIAVDAAGYVYVASQDPRQLALYAPLVPGSQSPQPLAAVAIPQGTTGSLDSDPIGIALDGSGRIYLANGEGNAIFVYPARSGSSLSATPSATIAGSMTTLDEPVDVAVDASGKIYVVDQDYPYGLKVFGANPSGAANEAPLAHIAGSQTGLVVVPNSVAVDHLGIIYVGSATDTGYSEIFEFPANPSGTLDETPMGMVRGAGLDPGSLAAK